MWKKRVRRIVWNRYCDLRLRAMVTGIFALIWWGVLYPELCFTEDTFQQVIVADGDEKVIEEASYRDILNASGESLLRADCWNGWKSSSGFDIPRLSKNRGLLCVRMNRKFGVTDP